MRALPWKGPRHANVWTGLWWDGPGRALVEAGPAPLALGWYLMTGPSSLAWGLYKLPVDTLEGEVNPTGLLDVPGTLTALEDAGIAFYDVGTSWVYLPHMAWWQVCRGTRLEPQDARCRGAERWYELAEPSLWLPRWWDDNAALFHLTAKRDEAGRFLSNPPAPVEPAWVVLSPYRRVKRNLGGSGRWRYKAVSRVRRAHVDPGD